MAPSTHDVVSRVQEVCPLPATTQRVVALTSNPDVQLEEVAQAIACDVALTAEVMRIANSAAYGRSRQVADLAQAVMTLGLNEIHLMATAMAMLVAFRSEHEISLGFHETAVVSGSIARSIAHESKLAPGNTAFLCGLLSEIGAMACLAVDSDGFSELWTEAAGSELARLKLEASRYGNHSRTIGATLLRRNELPEEVASAVACAWEHDSEPAETTPLASVTMLARSAIQPLLAASKDQNRDALETALEELAARTHVPLTGSRLADLCVEASGRALGAMS